MDGERFGGDLLTARGLNLPHLDMGDFRANILELTRL